MASQAQGGGRSGIDLALIYTPLLLIPLLIYNFLVLTGVLGRRQLEAGQVPCLMDGDGNILADGKCVTMVEQSLNSTVFSVKMFSGDLWNVSFGDIFLVICLFLLFIETVKSTRTDAASIVNHGLSMVVAMVAIIQFMTMQGFSNSVFLLLTIMQVVDVIAGFTVTIVGAKRDFGGSPGVAGTP